jgi:hypothetical protein
MSARLHPFPKVKGGAHGSFQYRHSQLVWAWSRRSLAACSHLVVSSSCPFFESCDGLSAHLSRLETRGVGGKGGLSCSTQRDKPGSRAFYSSRRRTCAEIHSIDGLRRSGYSFIIWEKNCNCVGLAARRPLASLRYFRVAAMFDGSSSRVLSL